MGGGGGQAKNPKYLFCGETLVYQTPCIEIGNNLNEYLKYPSKMCPNHSNELSSYHVSDRSEIRKIQINDVTQGFT